MIPNNNLSVLPFYTDLQKQQHRKDYSFGDIYPLITPDKRILPFQFIRPHRTNSFTGIFIKRLDGTTFLSIGEAMLATGFVRIFYESLGYDIIMYPGLLQMNIVTPEGQYYLELGDGVQTWYSEVFTVVRNVSEYMKLTYWDNESLIFDDGRVDFTNSFKFNLYLPTQVGRPDYNFDEVVDNRDGYQFVEKQVSEKVYKFNFVAPEYLLDAMRIIRMMDNLEIISKGETYEVDQFLLTPKWESVGNLASVEAEFQCNTILKKLPLTIMPFVGGPDFNNDFNNDFKIT